ncbi:MAG: hypothetical protein WKI49_04360 [Aquificaceae bacterium]
MRVRFRVVVYSKEGKKLSKEDFIAFREPLYIGIRYVVEFKYLEATKWLMLAKDCQEKYLLLALLNFALGQDTQAHEFLQEALKHERATDYLFVIEKPEEGLKVAIERIEASLPDFLLSL